MRECEILIPEGAATVKIDFDEQTISFFDMPGRLVKKVNYILGTDFVSKSIVYPYTQYIGRGNRSFDGMLNSDNGHTRRVTPLGIKKTEPFIVRDYADEFPARILELWKALEEAKKVSSYVVVNSMRYGKTFYYKFWKFEKESDLKGKELIEAFYKHLRNEKK